MKNVNIMLVTKTTRILPPFEMPLPPALSNISDVTIIRSNSFSNYHFQRDLSVRLKERKKKRREKERGNVSSKDKISSVVGLMRKT